MSIDKLQALKNQIVALNNAAIDLKAKTGKTRNELNIVKKVERFYKGVSKYIYDYKPTPFKKVSDGTGKPTPQARELQPEENEDDGAVLANNSDTPKGKDKQKKQRKKRGPNKKK